MDQYFHWIYALIPFTNVFVRFYREEESSKNLFFME